MADVYIFPLLLVVLYNVFSFVKTEVISHTEYLNITHLPPDILPPMRIRRSVSSEKFRKLQGNWRFTHDEILEMFADYYKCITKANRPSERVTNPLSAVLALEGQEVELPCPVCLRPDQPSPFDSMFWQRVRVTDAVTAHVDPKTPGIKIEPDMTLIFKVDMPVAQCNVQL